MIGEANAPVSMPAKEHHSLLSVTSRVRTKCGELGRNTLAYHDQIQERGDLLTCNREATPGIDLPITRGPHPLRQGRMTKTGLRSLVWCRIGTVDGRA